MKKLFLLVLTILCTHFVVIAQFKPSGDIKQKHISNISNLIKSTSILNQELSQLVQDDFEADLKNTKYYTLVKDSNAIMIIVPYTYKGVQYGEIVYEKSSLKAQEFVFWVVFREREKRTLNSQEKRRCGPWSDWIYISQVECHSRIYCPFKPNFAASVIQQQKTKQCRNGIITVTRWQFLRCGC